MEAYKHILEKANSDELFHVCATYICALLKQLKLCRKLQTCWCPDMNFYYYQEAKHFELWENNIGITMECKAVQLQGYTSNKYPDSYEHSANLT